MCPWAGVGTGRGTATSSPDIHDFLQPARQPRGELVNLGAGGPGGGGEGEPGGLGKEGLDSSDIITEGLPTLLREGKGEE